MGFRHAVAAIVTLTSISVGAMQAVPNLAGTWRLDAAQGSATGGGNGQRESGGGGRGGGLGLGPAPDQLVVQQDAKAVTIEEHRGTDSAKVVLTLDGKYAPRVIAVGRSAGAAASARTMVADGRLVTEVTLPATPANGNVTKYQETRFIDAKGQLVVDITMVGSGNSRHTVYIKAR